MQLSRLRGPAIIFQQRQAALWQSRHAGVEAYMLSLGVEGSQLLIAGLARKLSSVGIMKLG